MDNLLYWLMFVGQGYLITSAIVFVGFFFTAPVASSLHRLFGSIVVGLFFPFFAWMVYTDTKERKNLREKNKNP